MMTKSIFVCKTAALAAFILFAQPARAENVAVVNGQAITSADVAARGALLKALSRKTPSKSVLINELIDEKLKEEEATRLGVTADDEQVNKSYGELAKNNKMTTAKLSDVLKQLGASETEFKKRLHAEIGWIQSVRQKAQGGGTNPAFLPAPSSGNQATEYQVQQVVFTVPRNAPAASFSRRMGEANAARSRFNGCESGLAMLKKIKDVAVKPPVNRSSLTLTPAIQKDLANTAEGRLSSPVKGNYGIEMLAVCDKKGVVDDSLFGSQRLLFLQNKSITGADMEKAAKDRLKEMRDAATIVRN